MQDLNSIHSTTSNSMLIHFQVLGHKLIYSLLLEEAISKDLFSPTGISVGELSNYSEGLEWEKTVPQLSIGGASG